MATVLSLTRGPRCSTRRLCRKRPRFTSFTARRICRKDPFLSACTAGCWPNLSRSSSPMSKGGEITLESPWPGYRLPPPYRLYPPSTYPPSALPTTPSFVRRRVIRQPTTNYPCNKALGYFPQKLPFPGRRPRLPRRPRIRQCIRRRHLKLLPILLLRRARWTLRSDWLPSSWSRCRWAASCTAQSSRHVHVRRRIGLVASTTDADDVPT